MSAPENTYRDATFSAKTQEGLIDAYDFLRSSGFSSERFSNALAALRLVIAKWDENDATETTFE